MIWWLIPVLATVAAWVFTRVAGRRGGRVRPRPEPGSAQDARDLARFAAALGYRSRESQVRGERRGSDRLLEDQGPVVRQPGART